MTSVTIKCINYFSETQNALNTLPENQHFILVPVIVRLLRFKRLRFCLGVNLYYFGCVSVSKNLAGILKSFVLYSIRLQLQARFKNGQESLDHPARTYKFTPIQNKGKSGYLWPNACLLGKAPPHYRQTKFVL